MRDASAAPLPSTVPTVERVRAHYIPLCAAAMTHFGVGSLAGRLLLIDGLAAEGDALLIAASIAGGASLVLETWTEAIRYCVRNGIVDFAVTTLDESLRILKNEVRKQQPIAVLLEQEPEAVLAEVVERGAQPDMLRWPAPELGLKPLLDTLRDRGAQPIPEPSPGNADTDDVVRWRAADGGSAVLRQLDTLAGQVLPREDAERQNWIARAPRYLPRALRLVRCVVMNPAEHSVFLQEVEERAQQQTLVAPVEVEAGGQVRTFGQPTK